MRDGDLVDEGGVVPAGAVQALEGDRVRPGGDGERGGRVVPVGRARGRERADDHPVDQDARSPAATPAVGPLGGVEAQHVGAGGPAGDGLAERAGRPGGRRPGRPRGAGGLPAVKPLPLPEIAGARRRRSRASRPGRTGTGRPRPAPARNPASPIADGAGLRDGDLVDEGGVVAAGAVQALEGDRVRPGRDRERGGRVALVRRPRGRERPDHARRRPAR